MRDSGLFSNRLDRRVCLIRSTLPIILAIFALTACEAELSSEELSVRANSAADAGNWDAASLDAKVLLQRNPNAADARRILGDRELWEQRPAVAAEEYRRAVDASNDPALLIRYAEALVRAGEFETFSELLLENFFERASTDPLYLAALARAQLSWGAEAEAFDTIGEALRLSPNDLHVRHTQIEILARTGTRAAELIPEMEAVTSEYANSDRAWSYLGRLYLLESDYSGAQEPLEQAIRVNPWRFDDRLRLISSYLRAGDRDRARKQLDYTRKLSPSDPRVSLLIAELAVYEKDYDNALNNANKVLRFDSRHPTALYVAAIANSEQGNYEMARRQLGVLNELDPENNDLKLRLSSVSSALGEHESSIEIARAVLESDPMNTSALRILAVALALTGDNAASLEAYAQALELGGEVNETLLADYGSQLARGGEMEAAIEQLYAARELQPDSSEIRTKLIVTLIASGDTNRALQEADQFVADRPDSDIPLALAGRVQHVSGDKNKANTLYKRAIELREDSIVGRNGLVSLAMERKDFSSAEAYLNEILDYHENELKTLLRLANVRELSGDLDGMESALQKAMEAHPTAPEPVVGLARYEASQNRPDKVITILTDAKQRHSNQPAIHELLATANFQLGEYGASRDAANKLVELTPARAESWVAKGSAEIGLKYLADAETSLRKALELKPTPEIGARLIGLLVGMKKFEAAEEVLQSLVGSGLTDAQYSLAEGQIATAAGDYARAAASFKRSVEDQPQSRTVILRSQALWRQGRKVTVFNELGAWLESNPNDAAVLAQLGSLQLREKNFDGATRSFTKLNELRPGDIAVLNNLAWSLRFSDPQQSLGVAEEALALQPSNFAVKDTYSVILAIVGRGEEALKLNEELIQAAPEQTAYVVSRARIVAQLGRTDEAVKLLDSLVARTGPVDSATQLIEELREAQNSATTR
ncbi:MAG: XrtA/PEP-CTERM system TPR-repeat protein PrsT [Pseudomonadota bacterium]